MDGLSAKPRPPVAHSRSERVAEGAVFFGYFLLGKQKKVTRSHGCERNTHGRESVFARRQNKSEGTRSRFRGNEERFASAKQD